MRYLKASDGRHAAFDIDKIISIEPMAENKYRLTLEGSSTQVERVTLKIDDVDMEKFIKGNTPAQMK